MADDRPMPTSGWSTACSHRRVTASAGDGTGSTWFAMPSRMATARTRIRPQAWRYRDYVIRAFNTDKPYDRFLTEQLAGDELDPDDPELRVATGYLRLGTYEYNQRNVRGQWADILNDITDVTGEVFLGLSIGCARCHDHKFDPILQKDYYRLQAFFTPLLPRDDLTRRRVEGVPSIDRDAPHGSKLRPTSCARSDALARPYRDKGTASAIAKFPDEIKAILTKPELGSNAAGTSARCPGLPADRLRARTRSRRCSRGPRKARWAALQKESSVTTPCGRLGRPRCSRQPTSGRSRPRP